MLNCKQGDLAIIVNSAIPNSPNIGKVVRCLEFVPADAIVEIAGKRCCLGTPAWRIETTIMRLVIETGQLMPSDIVEDMRLRPLRDNEEDDETLAWAGKPETINQ